MIKNAKIGFLKLPSYGLPIIPPVPCVQHQHICISPLRRSPIHLIQFQSRLNLRWGSSRAAALRHEKRRPIVFYSAVKILELEDQESVVFRNRTAIHFIDRVLIGFCRSKHAKERFPLVSSNRIANEN